MVYYRSEGEFISFPIARHVKRTGRLSLSTVVLSDIGIDMVPSIIDVWGYDREFCSSSPSPSPSSDSTPITQK